MFDKSAKIKKSHKKNIWTGLTRGLNEHLDHFEQLFYSYYTNVLSNDLPQYDPLVYPTKTISVKLNLEQL